MTNNPWTPIADADAIDEGQAIEVVVGDLILAVFRNNGELFAMDGMCAHQGGPIAQGKVEGGCVTCPWHGWQYELATGIQTINRQPLMKTFDVREQGGKIEVRIA
ncbi:Anthranilate 1,2-dioxygenase ferredoxin subunit [Rubripirellula tenax]|uniref:Anthranilate 1,2-dioxygenase ferredoxin subunit n=1 Tax=Rubripirellula tenax TaxID=2528015 RepID=A0A5C6EBE3_9BACT|nr:Rieske (2Fe-2S) protein [Rubripirellula tenax]TWU46302.1 Anthranilate 1,2-dioxygenase ferredoxin subunit [Rubripirellula tenax]